MNEDKGIEIKKVRIETTVKNPLKIKRQKDKRSNKNDRTRHKWKEKYYAQTDGNILMALYSDGKNRDFELVNTFDFAQHQQLGVKLYPPYKEKTLRGKKIQLPLMQRNGKEILLKPGQMVIFYEKKKEKPQEILESTNFVNRLYILKGLSIQRIKRNKKIYEYGSLVFELHQEARKADDLKKLDYKPDGQFRTGELKVTRKMNHNQFNALIEGIDFKITPLGKIIKL